MHNKFQVESVRPKLWLFIFCNTHYFTIFNKAMIIMWLKTTHSDDRSFVLKNCVYVVLCVCVHAYIYSDQKITFQSWIKVVYHCYYFLIQRTRWNILFKSYNIWSSIFRLWRPVSEYCLSRFIYNLQVYICPNYSHTSCCCCVHKTYTSCLFSLDLLVCHICSR